MKLAGDYGLSDIVRALQGNFSCQSVTKNSRGKPLPKENSHVRLELFFLRFEIYPDRVDVYRTETGDTGTETLIKLGTIALSE